MCCTKDSINNMEISTLKAIHHFCQQVRPFLREIFSTYDANSITQLEKEKLD